MTKPSVYAAIDCCGQGYELTVMTGDGSDTVSIDVEAEIHPFEEFGISDVLSKVASFGEVRSVSVDRWQGGLSHRVQAHGFPVVEPSLGVKAHRSMIDRLAAASGAGVFKNGRIFMADMFIDGSGRREKNTTILWAFDEYQQSQKQPSEFVGEL